MIRRAAAIVLAAMVAELIAILLLPHPVAGPSPSGLVMTPGAPGAAHTAASPSPTAPARATASAGASGPSGAVAIWPSLLQILPTSVAGSDVTRDPASEANAIAGEGLATYAAAIAAAVVGDNGENLASILLVEARPETDVAAWFAAWRRDFDAAACEAIGGPGTSATRRIGGRDVFVTACKGGGSVYHVLVRGGRTILSVLDLGPKSFGRQVLEHLVPGAVAPTRLGPG